MSQFPVASGQQSAPCAFKVGEHVAVAGDNQAGVVLGQTGTVRGVQVVEGNGFFRVELDTDPATFATFVAGELMGLEPFETARTA